MGDGRPKVKTAGQRAFRAFWRRQHVRRNGQNCMAPHDAFACQAAFSFTSQICESSEFRAISERDSGIVTLELFVSAGGIQPITAALEAGLREQEQHYPCSAVLP
jgi:hypothetical protein